VGVSVGGDAGASEGVRLGWRKLGSELESVGAAEGIVVRVVELGSGGKSALGARIGDALGHEVGVLVGVLVGGDDGASEGSSVGGTVGPTEGFSDRMDDAEGNDDGISLGCKVMAVFTTPSALSTPSLASSGMPSNKSSSISLSLSTNESRSPSSITVPT